MINAETVLVLGAHPDDGEFGCGGTIARFCEEGKQVYYAVFSLCEKSVPPEFPRDILKSEFQGSTKVLGIQEENLFIHNYEVRMFPTVRQEILEDLVTIRKKIKPDLVLLPSTSDLHQDHQTLSEEGVRAFKGTSILGYEMAWNNRVFNSEAFIRLDERHVKKLKPSGLTNPRPSAVIQRIHLSAVLLRFGERRFRWISRNLLK